MDSETSARAAAVSTRAIIRSIERRISNHRAARKADGQAAFRTRQPFEHTEPCSPYNLLFSKPPDRHAARRFRIQTFINTKEYIHVD
jgi:hypothetical protein